MATMSDTPGPEPVPELDPEVAEVWYELLHGNLEGKVPTISAENLAEVRAFPLSNRELALAGRSFDERPIDLSGPGGPIPTSLFTPHTGSGAEAVARHPAPCVVWVHGGGMVAGTRWAALEALDVADTTGAAVVSFDYRLAPEHRSPAAVEDCLAVVEAVIGGAAALGIDPDRVVLGGNSAGGGLAAAAALRLRDEAGPELAGLLLVCPMIDDRMETPSSRMAGDDVVWQRTSNEFGWRSLLGERFGSEDLTGHEVPSRATDLSGLPPTYIDVGSVDIFRDEDVAFASGIWAAGGAAELHVWPGGYHGFELMAPGAAISRAAVEARRSWFRRVVGSERG